MIKYHSIHFVLQLWGWLTGTTDSNVRAGTYIWLTVADYGMVISIITNHQCSDHKSWYITLHLLIFMTTAARIFLGTIRSPSSLQCAVLCTIIMQFIL